MMPYTEDTLVQQTTSEYLEQKLGWRSVCAYNNEDFGPNSLLGRASDRAVVLTSPLRKKLTELNPGLPDEAYDDAVRQIVATTATRVDQDTEGEVQSRADDVYRHVYRVYPQLLSPCYQTAATA